MRLAPTPLAFVVFVPLLLTGCVSKVRPSAPSFQPLQDRGTFVEQRTTELMKRGLPRDQALQKASGEWFNQTIAIDRRKEAEQRAQQAQINKRLSEIEREAKER